MRSVVRNTLLVCISWSALAGAAPYGGPAQVNRNASSNLAALDVAAAGNGDVIVLWQAGPQASGTGVLQRYDAAGRALTPEINAGAGAMRVAGGPAGSYALLTRQMNNDLSVTVFNRSGTPIASARVSDAGSPSSAFGAAVIAMNASGQFVVAWTSPRNGVPYFVFARRFEANGAPTGPPTLVHANSADSHRIGSVDAALDAVGNFVVAFDFGDIFALDFYNVFARRYNASGLPTGPELRVNTTTPGDQQASRIAMNGAGSYVIVWQGPPPGGTGQVVFAQRFSPAGSPLGSEFQITTASSTLGGLDVAMAPDGSFVTAWEDDRIAVVGQVLVREFTGAGIALGAATQVSAAVNDFAANTRIAIDPAGNYTITWWETHFTLTDFNKVLARRYATAGVAIQPIGNGQIISPLSGAAGSWQYFKLTVPPGQSTVDISIFGGTGDADVYTRWGALPTLSAWDGRPFLDGNTETARMLNFPPGDWYIGVNGFVDYAQLSLQASYRP